MGQVRCIGLGVPIELVGVGGILMPFESIRYLGEQVFVGRVESIGVVPFGG